MGQGCELLEDPEGGRGLTSLEEVFKRIEALKEDLEELGVDVHVAVSEVPRGKMTRPSLTVVSVVLKDLEEVVEA